MSIQSEKEVFLKECDYIMRLEKAVIEKVTENSVRGEHHAEKAYMVCEELKSQMHGLKPEHINFVKRQGGMSNIESNFDKLKSQIREQKEFYQKLVQQAKEVEEYSSRIIITMTYCNEVLAKINTSITAMDKIMKTLKAF